MAYPEDRKAQRTDDYRAAMFGPNEKQVDFGNSPVADAARSVTGALRDRGNVKQRAAALNWSERPAPREMDMAGTTDVPEDMGRALSAESFKAAYGSTVPGDKGMDAQAQTAANAGPGGTVPGQGKRGIAALDTSSSASGTASPADINSGMINRLGGGGAEAGGQALNSGAPRGQEPGGGVNIRGGNVSTGLGDFGQSARAAQQPRQGLDVVALYQQAMQPLDTSAPLAQMLAQAGQRKQARALLERELTNQGAAEQARISGDYDLQKANISGQFGLQEQGMRGEQALATGKQTGEFGLQEQDMRGKQALATGKQTGEFGLQEQGMRNEASERNNQLDAAVALQGQNQTALSQQRTMDEARRKEFTTSMADQVLQQMLQAGKVPKELAPMDEQGIRHMDKDLARAWVMKTYGSDPAALARSGFSPEGPRNPTQASAAAGSFSGADAPESNIFSPDKPRQALDLSGLVPLSTGHPDDPNLDKDELAKQPHSRQTKPRE
jgi:hypothetical protein